MYEKQEEFENKKKESKQAELQFREKEKELRQKDLAMQESMITFSVFLQDNENKKKQADDKIKKETALKNEKEEEFKRKEKEFEFLRKKAQRIDRKKKALMKYEAYLEDVKNNSDEFSEITDILNRHTP